MTKVSNKVKALFKKAYKYNWDNGIAGLTKIIRDKNCDKATALCLFWHGSPKYFYNDHTRETLEDYNLGNYELLKEIERNILTDTYPVAISYEVPPEFQVTPLGNIPAELAQPVMGGISYKDVLYPNNNPFQEQILALCQSCASVDEMYALEKEGANFSLKILNGYSYPIEVAINYGQTEAMKYFIEKEFDINKKYNKNPLFFNAVTNKHFDLVKLLVAHGVNVKKKGEFGRTALHVIAGWGDYEEGFDAKAQEIIEYLIAHGADIDAKDTDKKTPLDLAIMWENEKYIEFIKNQ